MNKTVTDLCIELDHCSEFDDREAAENYAWGCYKTFKKERLHSENEHKYINNYYVVTINYRIGKVTVFVESANNEKRTNDSTYLD